MEDDDDIRDILDLLLRMNRYLPVTARDGVQAMELLREGTVPALILVDLRMPRLDGAGLVRLLRTSRQWVDVPVVMLSGEVGAEAIAATVGVNAFLSKPVETDQLIDTITTLLAAAPGDGARV